MEKVKEQVKKVTGEELQKLQTIQTQFQGLKLQLGDIELHKQSVIQDVNELKSQFKLWKKAL